MSVVSHSILTFKRITRSFTISLCRITLKLSGCFNLKRKKNLLESYECSKQIFRCLKQINELKY